MLLWQDFRYQPGCLNKDDRGLRVDEGTINRLFEGQPTLIGVPKTSGAADLVYREDAAMILTGPFKLSACRNGKADLCETEQLDARVKYVLFDRSIRWTDSQQTLWLQG